MIDDGTTITSVKFDEDSPCDCWWIFSDAEEHGSAEKDAHLIAAAPDLLKALEDLLNVCKYDFDMNEMDDEECPTCGAARAAIAKANGEA
jgi:hypothetical protein